MAKETLRSGGSRNSQDLALTLKNCKVELQLLGWGAQGRAALGASPSCFEMPCEVVERGLGSFFADLEGPGDWKISSLEDGGDNSWELVPQLAGCAPACGLWLLVPLSY